MVYENLTYLLIYGFIIYTNRHRALREPSTSMKTIIRLALIIIALSIFAHAENQEWREFTAPFKQTSDGSRILVEDPHLPVSENNRFPRAGSYILNKHETLERELRDQGYKVLKNSEYIKLLALGTALGLLLLSICFVLSKRQNTH